MPKVAEPRCAAGTLLIEASVGIARRSVRIVGALAAFEVDLRILAPEPGVGGLASSLGLKLL